MRAVAHVAHDEAVALAERIGEGDGDIGHGAQDHVTVTLDAVPVDSSFRVERGVASVVGGVTVAGASHLTRAAERVGLRQPSLYQYFASRDAVFDALFERGGHSHLQALAEAMDSAPTPGWAAVRAGVYANLRFIVDHPVIAQLPFSRSLPGFRPSDQAFAPSLEVKRRVVAALNSAVERDELHPAAASERGLHLAIALFDGVANERAANQPELTSEQDLHDLLRPALEMYSDYFAPSRPCDWTPWPRQAGSTSSR